MVTGRVYNLDRYPRQVALRDGSPVLLKPMTPEDEEAVRGLFHRVPVPDRYYLKEDVTAPEVIHRWTVEIDYSRALPVLAWVGDRVVADATLHRTRALARHHRAEIRVVVDPEYRGRGLGVALIQDLEAVARSRGLEILVLEVVADEEYAAIRAAESVGFTRLAVLPGHAKNLKGHPKDIVLMEMRLEV